MSRQGSVGTRRLKQDYIRIMKDPVPYVKAHPLPQNMLEWHFAVLGPEDTPYEGGVYHGKLVFPSDYPFKPPSIYMITPNGRFRCNTRLCLSISDFHPDTWNPAWSVATILTGLLSFMVEKSHTLGSIETSEYEKRLLARRSLEFNLKNSIFCELFPDLVEECKTRIMAIRSNGTRNFDENFSSNQEIQNSQLQQGQTLLRALQNAECKTRIMAMRSNGSRNFDENFSSNQEIQNSQLQKGQMLLSALQNAVVVLGFAFFAYAVKYVLQGI